MGRKSLFVVALPLITLITLNSGVNPPRAVAQDRASAMQDTATDFRQIVSAATAKVFPSVVYIRVVSDNYDDGRKSTREGSGSGVLISPQGEVLTNWHVVEKAVEVRCLLSDGRAFRAEVVGTDKDTDIGLIRLQRKDDEPLPYAELGESAGLSEGEFVMAMGAPWGLNRSVSIGIISCVRRFLPEGSEYSLWLQTDASISPGNSGGPLVNTHGQVIGLNARGSMVGGDMGFAIPAETLRRIVPHLREHGAVKWAYTGLQLQPLRDFNRDVYFDGTDGVIVAHVEPDSPASAAGFQSRDRILSINDESVVGLVDEDLPAIRRTLALLPLEKPARVTVRRGSQQLALQLTPREKGKTSGDELDCPRWDFTARTINQFDNPDLFFHRKQGVFVKGVRSPGNAQTSGLQPNDILLQIDGKPVQSLDDVKGLHRTAVDNVGKSHRVLVTVLRNGLLRQVVLDFSRDYSRN